MRRGMLSGYKTYIAAVATIVGVVARYLVDPAGPQMPTAEEVQLILTAIFAMTIRHGVETSNSPF